METFSFSLFCKKCCVISFSLKHLWDFIQNLVLFIFSAYIVKLLCSGGIHTSYSPSLLATVLGEYQPLVFLGETRNLCWASMCNLAFYLICVTGKLVLTAYSKKGCGGAMMFTFKCHGCWTVEIDYKSSHLAQESRRQLVSLALSLAFFISGHGYAGYRETLGRGLGLGIVSEKPYLEVVDLALPYIKSMLDQMCDEAKEHMKEIAPDQIGSWSRAVTCCDGCWLIRGHFSQNCTFVIKNYITGALLYHGHLCMRGAETICDEELWQGTAKAAEGHLSQVL